MNKTQQELKCLQINLQHSSTASASLSQLILELDLDLILIQEPYLYSLNNPFPNLPSGYSAYHTLTLEHAYGAVIISKTKFHVKLLPDTSTNECVAVEVSHTNFKTYFISAYCRPSLDCVSDVMNRITRSCEINKQNVVICLDGNAHNTLWNSPTTDERGMELEEILLTNNLNIINPPESFLSFKPPHTTFVDVTIMGDSVAEKVTRWNYLSTPSLSDHYYIYFSLSLYPKRRQPDLSILPKLEQIDTSVARQLLRSELQQNNNTPYSGTERIDTEIDHLTNSIRSAITRSKIAFEPIKKKSVWWNRELCCLRHKLRQLYKVSRYTTDQTEAYNNQKALYQREIRKAKSQAWKTFCKEEFEVDPFKALKKITGKLHRNKQPTTLITDNQTTTNELSILKILSKTFFPANPVNLSPHDVQMTTFMNNIVSVDSEDVPEVLIEEMHTAIFSMKRRKSPGMDGITSEHIQFFYDLLKPSIINIYNSCLCLSYFPKSWKIAKVIVLAKPGRDNYKNPSSFRPISLLPVFGKVLEKIILNRLVTMPNCRWFSDSQHGFRKGKSTVTALEDLTQEIRTGYRKKSYTSCVLLDIKGAFDNAWHPSIIVALHRKSCPTYLLKSIKSFLSQRSATLSLNDLTHTAIIERGCPLGGVLSPFLWNIVIDEALTMPSRSGAKIQAFADDIIITKTGMNKDSIQNHLQVKINELVSWGKRNQLVFSGPKSEAITFSRKHKNLDDLVLTLDDIAIQHKSQVKYLGVIMDRKLTWRSHIEAKHIACKRKIMELRQFSRLTWGADRNILTKLLNGIVDPMLLYAAPIWIESTQRKWCQTKLRSIQRLILATTLRSFKTISTSTALVLSGSVPMEMRAQNLAIQSQLKRYNSPAVRYHIHNSAFIPAVLRHCNIDPSQLDIPCNPLLLPSPIPISISPTPITPTLLPSDPTHVYLFTDGSKSSEGVAFAVVSTTRQGIGTVIRRRLPDNASIFEAESCAISVALDLIRSNIQQYSAASIYTDSRASLQALSSKKKLFRP